MKKEGMYLHKNSIGMSLTQQKWKSQQSKGSAVVEMPRVKVSTPIAHTDAQ